MSLTALFNRKLTRASQILREGGWTALARHIVKRLQDVCPIRSVVLLELDLRSSLLELPRPKLALACRMVTEQDIPALAALMPEGSEAEIRRRLAAGERCHVAVYQGEILSYAWATERGALVIPYVGWKRPLPPKTTYGYGLYVQPRYRGKGISIWLMREYFAFIRNQGYEVALAVVEPHNRTALRGDMRLGFRPARQLYGLRAFGRWWHWSGRPAPEALEEFHRLKSTFQNLAYPALRAPASRRQGTTTKAYQQGTIRRGGVTPATAAAAATRRAGLKRVAARRRSSSTYLCALVRLPPRSWRGSRLSPAQGTGGFERCSKESFGKAEPLLNEERSGKPSLAPASIGAETR